MQKSSKYLFVVLPIVIGLLTGYLFLHPASVFIFYLFEKNVFDPLEIIREAFSFVHFVMSLYFTSIGGILGGAVALYLVTLINANSWLFDINTGLMLRHNQFKEKVAAAEIDGKAVLQRIGPALSKIENSVEMVTNQSAGSLNMRQSVLLSITKQNIENLYEIIGSLVFKEENEGE